MPATQHGLRRELDPGQHPVNADARRHVCVEIAGLDTLVAEARAASAAVGLALRDELFEGALERWHKAAEAAEWLLENPNARAILRARGRLNEVQEWAALRTAIEQWAIDLHRRGCGGEGA